MFFEDVLDCSNNVFGLAFGKFDSLLAALQNSAIALELVDLGQLLRVNGLLVFHRCNRSNRAVRSGLGW